MRVYKNIVLCAIFILVHNAISFAQINIVTNPSFEILSTCPSSIDQIDSAIGWNTPLSGGGSPDLYNVCCTAPPLCGVPSQTNFHTFQYPHSGNEYAGIDVAICYYVDNWREYIQSKLRKKLSAGHIYCVTFYASLSDQGLAFIRPLGAYLDNGSITAPAPYGLATVTPQIYNTSQLLNDTVNWMKVEGSFTAIGTEEYITIGNFFSDSASNIGMFGTPSDWFSYYYIDDVSVIDANLPAFAGNDTLIYPGDSIFIGRQPEVGLNEDCIWFINGLPKDTIAGMWVKPDSTTTYILEQTICGNVRWDTVTVSVSGVGIEDYFNEAAFKIYPNPATPAANRKPRNKRHPLH